MLFHQVGDIAKLKECQGFKATNIWNKDVLKLSPVQLMATYNRLKIKLGKRQALDAMRYASNEALAEYILGDLSHCPLISFTPETTPYSASEIGDLINQFEILERRAIMFAIYANLRLGEVTKLTRKSALIKLNIGKPLFKEGARYIIDTQPRHISSPHLFWRLNAQKQPQRLFDLEMRFYTRTAIDWNNFMENVRSACEVTDLI